MNNNVKKKYAVLHFRKIKSKGDLLVAYNHNFRKDGYAPNAIPSRKEFNEELVHMNTSSENYVEILERRIKESPYYSNRKVMQNAVLAVEFILSSSRDAIADYDEWKRANMEWLLKKFRTNVISAVFHDDEISEAGLAVPHIHAIVLPFSEIGSLRFKSLIPNKYFMVHLQTEYAEAMSEFNLIRGTVGSRSRHREPWKYHQIFDDEIARYKDNYPVKAADEELSLYLDRTIEYSQNIFRKMIKEILDLKSELERLESVVRNYELGIDIDAVIDKARKKTSKFRHDEMLIANPDYAAIWRHLRMDAINLEYNNVADIKRARKISSLGDAALFGITQYPDKELRERLFNDIMQVRAYEKEQKRKQTLDLSEEDK